MKDEVLTVGELVEHLGGMDPTALVVALGHFGETYGFTQRDFVFEGESPVGVRGPFLVIRQIDVGPEPD